MERNADVLRPPRVLGDEARHRLVLGDDRVAVLDIGCTFIPFFPSSVSDFSGRSRKRTGTVSETSCVAGWPGEALSK